MKEKIVVAKTRTGGVSEDIGTYKVRVFEDVEEVVEAIGVEAVMHLVNKQYGADVGLVARKALLEEGSTAEKVAKVVLGFIPGARKLAPTLKNFTELSSELSAAGNVTVLVEAMRIFNEEGLKEAFEYIIENK